MGFLVHINDREALQRVFEANTCIWGGCFNAIIPVLNRTPRWWSEKPFRNPSAKDIISGYLDCFEPDFLVTTQLEPSLHLPFPKERVVSLEDVLSGGRDEYVCLGLSVIDLYRDLYKREFQFVRRHPVKVVHPILHNSKFSLFVAACFGAFPAARDLAYFNHSYGKAFDATDMQVDETNLLKIMRGRFETPLRMGCRQLEIRPRGWSSGPALFFMDATQPRDLIDFWNLRALGWEILPVPKQWTEKLAEQCRSFIQENYIPLRGNPQNNKRTTLLKSRSVKKEDFEAFGRQIAIKRDHSLALQHWYPRMWDEWARDNDRIQRCDINADEGDTESGTDKGRITFKALSPAFAERFRETDKPGWANVVQVRDYSLGSELAQVLPPGIGDLDRLLETYEHNATTVNSEGSIIFSRHLNWTHRWKVPDGFSVFQSWLASQGFRAELSDKGKIALQLIRCLDGPLGAHLICNLEILKLLDSLAHGLVELSSENHQAAKKPLARARIVTRDKLWGIIQKVNSNDHDRAERHFKNLIEKSVLGVGMEIQCPQCTQSNWYALGEITEQLRCQRCLREFPFPADNPPNKAWSYRSQGPFSVENYAHGSYTVALVLRFLLLSGDHAEATWIPGLYITDGYGESMEIDFGVWLRNSLFDASKPMLLIGECKSLNPFQRKDFTRAARLAKLFPGACLVFATLRDRLGKNEKIQIIKLARRGRRHLRAERLRNPVLVLTSHELMSHGDPPYCWRDAGGKFAQFADRFRGFGGLRELCDATQQLHLDMESYTEWQQGKLKL